jgi:hypothetical protein
MAAGTMAAGTMASVAGVAAKPGATALFVTLFYKGSHDAFSSLLPKRITRRLE